MYLCLHFCTTPLLTFKILKELLMKPYWAPVTYLDFHPQKNILLLGLLMLPYRKEQLFIFSFWVASCGIANSLAPPPPLFVLIVAGSLKFKMPFMLRVCQLEAFVAKGVTNVIANFDRVDKLGWLEAEGNLSPEGLMLLKISLNI